MKYKFVLILMCGVRGGEGKTFTAAELAAFLIRIGYTPVLLDLDPANSKSCGLSKYYPAASAVTNLTDNDAFLAMIDQLAGMGGRQTIGIADMPGSSDSDLNVVENFGAFVPALIEEGIFVLPAVVVTAVKEYTIQALQRWFSLLGKSCTDWLLIKNLRYGDDFTAFDNAPEVKKIYELNNMIEVSMPALLERNSAAMLNKGLTTFAVAGAGASDLPAELRGLTFRVAAKTASEKIEAQLKTKLMPLILEKLGVEAKK